MPIQFECSGCGKRLRARDTDEGRSARCPRCGQRMQIPAGEWELRAPSAEHDGGKSMLQGVLADAGRLVHKLRPGKENAPAARSAGEEDAGGKASAEPDAPSPLEELDLGLYSRTQIPKTIAMRVAVTAAALLGLGTLIHYGPGLLGPVMQASDPLAYLRALLSLELGRPALWSFTRNLLMSVFALVIVVGAWPALRLQPKGRSWLQGGLLGMLLVAATDLGVLWMPGFGVPAGGEHLTVRLRQLALYGGAGVVGLLIMSRGAGLFGGEAKREPDYIDLVDRLLSEALRVRASDVHVEPGPGETAIRYRIDGVLHTVARYPLRVLDRLVARIKVIGRMDIAEKRLPQDGGAKMQMLGKAADLRISTVPSEYGERAVVRLLDPETGLLGLDGLGLSPRLAQKMDEIISSPHGVFFCTGPTGSGKTTTLYAALMRANRQERNVITVEEPVEYHLPGITQLPVGRRKGMNFVSGLRSILRQDPDVIMVGEVRDSETAHMVIEAAQTGHLVLSTLHTNDSAGAVSRLLDLNVEPFLLASSLKAVVAQRLVRRVCARCCRPYTPALEELRELGIDLASAPTVRRAVGCAYCMQTGYRSRIGLFELLVVDDQIRELIGQRADANTIHRQAIASGMIDLRADGARKVVDGITTIEEVRRVTADTMEY